MDFKFFKPWVKQCLVENFFNDIADAIEEQLIILKRVDSLLLTNFIVQKTPKAIDELCQELDQLSHLNFSYVNDDVASSKKKRKELKRQRKLLKKREDSLHDNVENSDWENQQSESSCVTTSVSTKVTTDELSEFLQNYEKCSSEMSYSRLKTLKDLLDNYCATEESDKNILFEGATDSEAGKIHIDPETYHEISQQINDLLEKNTDHKLASSCADQSQSNSNRRKKKSQSTDSNSFTDCPLNNFSINSKGPSNLPSVSRNDEDIEINNTSRQPEIEDCRKPNVHKKFFAHLNNILLFLNEDSRKKIEEEFFKAVSKAGQNSILFKRELENSDFFNYYKKSKRKNLKRCNVQDMFESVPAPNISSKLSDSKKIQCTVPSRANEDCLDGCVELVSIDEISTEKSKKKKKRDDVNIESLLEDFSNLCESIKDDDFSQAFLSVKKKLNDIELDEVTSNSKSSTIRYPMRKSEIEIEGNSVLKSSSNKNAEKIVKKSNSDWNDEKTAEASSKISDDIATSIKKRGRPKKLVELSKANSTGQRTEKGNTDETSLTSSICKSSLKSKKTSISKDESEPNALNDIETLISESVIETKSSNTHEHKSKSNKSMPLRNEKEISCEIPEVANSDLAVVTDDDCSMEPSNLESSSLDTLLKVAHDEDLEETSESSSESSSDSIEVLNHVLTDVSKIKEEVDSSDDENENFETHDSSSFSKSQNFDCGTSSKSKEIEDATELLMDPSGKLRGVQKVEFEINDLNSEIDIKVENDYDGTQLESVLETVEALSPQPSQSSVIDENEYRLLEKELLELERCLQATEKKNDDDKSASQTSQPLTPKDSDAPVLISCTRVHEINPSSFTILESPEEEVEDPFKCTSGKNGLETKSAFIYNQSEHIREDSERTQSLTIPHEKKNSCGECVRVFKSEIALKKHANQTHLKKNSCGECVRGFKSEIALKKHVNQTHLKKKKFNCRFCSEVYQFKNQLKKHELEAHIEVSKYSCSVCDFKCSLKGSLTQHLLKHSDVRSFRCPDCCKSFKTKGALVSHRVVHTNDRPFVCGICSVGFKLKAGLNQHYKTHPLNTYFYCNLCNYKARSLDLVISHKKCKHFS